MKFIIDTNIWKSVAMITDSNIDNSEIAMTCLHFLSTFYHKCKDVIVLDTENTIYNEYYNNINQKSLVLGILKKVIFCNKTTWVSKNGLEIAKILEALPFDPDDVKFLELNAKLRGENTIIITIDSDFVKLRDILEKDPDLRSRLQNPIIMNPKEVLEEYYH